MSKINLNVFVINDDYQTEKQDRKRIKKQKKRVKKYKKQGIYKAMDPQYHLRENRESREIKDKGFVVTDHAIARYYERVEGVNMNELKESIVPNNVKELICTHKNGELHVKGKYRIRFKDKKVITIKT